MSISICMNPLQITKIFLELTTYCNSHCPQCPRFDKDGFVRSNIKMDHLSFDTLRKSIDKNVFLNLKTVVIEGDRGDGIMHPDILEIIKYFDFVKEIIFYTNGGARNTIWWSKLSEIKNLKVIFSIDGLEDTNKLYRVNVDYEKVINNAIAFINNGGHAIWKCILFKHNEHQIQEITELSEKLGFYEIEFSPALMDRFDNINEFPVKIDGILQHFISPSIYNGDDVRKFSKKHKEGNIEIINNNNKRCTWLNLGKIYINYMGYVLPCCMSFELPSVKNKIGFDFLRVVGGNIKDISIHYNKLEKIITNKFYNDLLEKSLETENTAMILCKTMCSDRIGK